MFFRLKVKVKPFNLTENKKNNVEAKYKIQAEEENKDDEVPALTKDVTEVENKDTYEKSIAGKADDQDATAT